jgi:hypothetical protein
MCRRVWSSHGVDVRGKHIRARRVPPGPAALSHRCRRAAH